jgi:hypothetical protein
MDFDCFYQYLTTDVQHVLYAGNATAVTNLKKLDGTINSLTLGSLKRAHSALESIGAEPIMVERKSGEEFPVYGAFITAHDFANLKLDPAYAKANELAGLRGEDNPIFTGAVGMIDGMMIYVCRDIRGDGSPLRPEAKIYGAHAADATTIVVGSDTSGIIDYTEFFPSSGTLSIVNESGAVEYVTYSGKGTYRFTGCTRAATYGDVTSTASAYTGGATNREYVTLGHMQSHLVCFGAQSMMRAFSKQMAYTKQERDYGNEIGVGIKWIGGHKATKNSNGVNRGYVVMKTCGLSYDVAA